MLENITLVFQNKNIIMAVNIFEELNSFLTASERDVFCVAHVDWYSPQLLWFWSTVVL